jgi:hypothetical protein
LRVLSGQPVRGGVEDGITGGVRRSKGRIHNTCGNLLLVGLAYEGFVGGGIYRNLGSAQMPGQPPRFEGCNKQVLKHSEEGAQ